MRESLGKNVEELENPDKPFNSEEAKIWAERLDELVVKFEKFQEDNKIQKDELDSLKRDVKDLELHIESIPKKIWVTAAGNKIINTLEKLSNSKFAQALVEITIRGLLGQGAQ